jgi:hypothetical protein
MRQVSWPGLQDVSPRRTGVRHAFFAWWGGEAGQNDAAPQRGGAEPCCSFQRSEAEPRYVFAVRRPRGSGRQTAARARGARDGHLSSAGCESSPALVRAAATDATSSPQPVRSRISSSFNATVNYGVSQSWSWASAAAQSEACASMTARLFVNFRGTRLTVRRVTGSSGATRPPAPRAQASAPHGHIRRERWWPRDCDSRGRQEDHARGHRRGSLPGSGWGGRGGSTRA